MSSRGADRPDVSVIVASLDTRDDLARCLAALPAAGGALATETIVVDNGSTDGTQRMIAERFPAVRLIQNAENAGFARAINAGAAVARGAPLLVLNSDCELCPGALAVMTGVLDREARVGAVLCRLLNGDGSLQPSVHRRFPSPWTTAVDALCLAALRHRLYRMPRLHPWLLRGTRRRHRVSHDVAWGGGACLLVRRRAWADVAGFDEGFFFFWEDVDLCRRLGQAGWRVRYVAEASAVHHWGRSSARLHAIVLREAYRGRIHYFDKHAPGAGVAFVRALAVVELRVRYALFSALARVSRRAPERPREQAAATQACLKALRYR